MLFKNLSPHKIRFCPNDHEKNDLYSSFFFNFSITKQKLKQKNRLVIHKNVFTCFIFIVLLTD